VRIGEGRRRDDRRGRIMRRKGSHPKRGVEEREGEGEGVRE
jgi:hypothetical protein